MLKINLNNCSGIKNKSITHVNFSSAEKILPEKNYRKITPKMLVLDIDGTISDRYSNSIDEDVKKEIFRIKKKGIKVILNSGRSYQQMVPIIN